jgi:hypothetical protein
MTAATPATARTAVSTRFIVNASHLMVSRDAAAAERHAGRIIESARAAGPGPQERA